MARWYYVNAVVPTSLLSLYCVLIGSALRYVYYFQNLLTSAKTIKIALRLLQFLLRYFYVLEVRTASDRFYMDRVATWSSMIVV